MSYVECRNSRGTQLKAKFDRFVSKVTNSKPSVYETDGRRTYSVHHRFGAPETSRWVVFDNCNPTVVRSSDVVHLEQEGKLIDRRKVEDIPPKTIVLQEGESYYNK